MPRKEYSHSCYKAGQLQQGQEYMASFTRGSDLEDPWNEPEFDKLLKLLSRRKKRPTARSI